MTKILADEAIEDIPNLVHKAKLFPGEASKKIMDSSTTAIKRVSDEVGRLRALTADASNKIRLATKELVSARQTVSKHEAAAKQSLKIIEDAEENIFRLQNMPDFEVDRSAIRRVEDLIQKRSRAEANLIKHTDEGASAKTDITRLEDVAAESEINRDTYAEQFARLSRLHQGMVKSPQAAISTMMANPDTLVEFPVLSNWFETLSRHLPDKSMAMKAQSRYIDSNRKFFKEYLNEIYPVLKANPKDPYVNAWMLNPDNARKLSQLRTGKKYRNLLREIELDPAEAKKLAEIQKKLRAQKLKQLAAGTGVAGVGAVAFLTLFDEESKNISQQSNQVIKTSNFKVTGPGKAVLDQARTASSQAIQTINAAQTDLAKTPTSAAPKLMKELADHKDSIDKAVDNWDLVLTNTNDYNRATNTKNELVALSNSINTMLGQTQRITESLGGGVAGDKRQPKTITREHIRSIQNYLRSRYPTVAPTGNLDQPTVKALKQLERELDTAAKTGGRISEKGLLVRTTPGREHLITLADLKRLELMARK